MPGSRWQGRVRFLTRHSRSPGFAELWAEAAPGFSEDFRAWLAGELAGDAPGHDDGAGRGGDSTSAAGPDGRAGPGNAGSSWSASSTSTGRDQSSCFAHVALGAPAPLHPRALIASVVVHGAAATE
jgi:hypothetical protein